MENLTTSLQAPEVLSKVFSRGITNQHKRNTPGHSPFCLKWKKHSVTCSNEETVLEYAVEMQTKKLIYAQI